MKQSILQAIVAFVCGQKYYVNIVNRRGTNICEISSYIFSTKEQAEQHRRQVEATTTFLFIQTVTFRSRHTYRYVTNQQGINYTVLL